MVLKEHVATFGVIIVVAFLIGIALGVGYTSMNHQSAGNLNIGDTAASPTLRITKVLSVGYVESVFHNGTCTQPTVAYSTMTNTYYEVPTLTNATQNGYSVVIVVSNTTNFTPFSTTLVEQDAPCNPLANGTSTSSH